MPAKLPNESRDDLRALATIGEGDIALCQAFIEGLDGTVKYFEGRAVRRVNARSLRALWFAESQ